MRRTAVYLLGLSIIACGTNPAEPSSGGPADPPAPPKDFGTPVAGISAARLAVGVTDAKVVVSTSHLVDVPIEVSNPMGENNVFVACTAAGSECDPYGTMFPGVHCASTATSGTVCVLTQQKTSLFYVQNVPVQDGRVSVSLPCDSSSYQVELYGASNGVIQDAKKTATPLSFDSACNGGPATWIDQVKPTLAFPTIYAGLPAPYDRYTVGVQHLAYPWSTSFTMTCNGSNPIGYVTAGATFAAPSAGGVDCTAAFQLDRSILSSAELANAWKYDLRDGAATTGSVLVTGP